jgi:hypothetical protein
LSVHRAVWITVALLVFAVAMWSAGAMGFLVGGTQIGSRFAPAEAVFTIATLRTLRENDVEGAIDKLESTLDGQILDHSHYDPSLARWFDPMPIFFWWYELDPDPDAPAELMRRVAKYRRSHPTTSNTPEVRQAIEDHLAQFD